ncbi:MAG: hypothetical protein HUK03_05780, partial [Bacteroidaceae bacterium]|nr:hypothetical protein [Bacteroidaceae bacterium]
TMSVKFKDLGMEDKGNVILHDMWTHKDIGTHTLAFSLSVPPHSCRIIRLRQPGQDGTYGAPILSKHKHVTQHDNDVVLTLRTDASEGDFRLYEIPDTTTLYAHIGLITQESTSDQDWKHTSTWGDNSTKFKLYRTGRNTYQLKIGNLRDYFHADEKEVIKKIAFTVRTANGKKVSHPCTASAFTVDVDENEDSKALVEANLSPVYQGSDNIHITYYAASEEGNKQLMDLADNEEVYAHTGVITQASTSPADWKHGTDWNNPTAKHKMERVSKNVYRLNIGNIRSFYGVDGTTENIQQLAFVFRTRDGSKVGKTREDTDIFVEVADAEQFLPLTSTSPEQLNQNSDNVVLTFHANSIAGNCGLKNLDPSVNIYAHTGVITDSSTSDDDWKYPTTWGNNAEKYKLTRVDANTYTLNIGNLRNYYGVKTRSEIITKLAFVFRTEDAGNTWQTGVRLDGGNILVDVAPTQYLPIITTYPETLTNSTNDATLTFNANARDGSNGLKGLPWTETVYAHMGAITNRSTSTADWKYASIWEHNNVKYRMERVSTDLYSLRIGNLRKFFGITDETEQIEKIAIVFRTENVNNYWATGVMKDGGDVLVDVEKGTTGITDLDEQESLTGNTYYNLLGQPVSPTYRGIVITKNKKVLLK